MTPTLNGFRDGGPAFPRIEPPAGGNGPVIYYGMSLRDYFASQVISQCVGLCSTLDKDAEQAYVIADAMLKARKS